MVAFPKPHSKYVSECPFLATPQLLNNSDLFLDSFLNISKYFLPFSFLSSMWLIQLEITRSIYVRLRIEFVTPLRSPLSKESPFYFFSWTSLRAEWSIQISLGFTWFHLSTKVGQGLTHFNFCLCLQNILYYLNGKILARMHRHDLYPFRDDKAQKCV